MKKVIIKQKMSGTGTIHDIESDSYNREIIFKAGTKYAVVLAAYYGYNLYTTHKTAESAIAKSNKEREYSHMIIDDEGNYYYTDGYVLSPIW